MLTAGEIRRQAPRANVSPLLERDQLRSRSAADRAAQGDPPLRRRRLCAAVAVGIAAAGASRQSGLAVGALDRMHVTLDRGLIATLDERHMSGNEGREIVVKHVQGNGRQLGIR
jgi:hypothetical protein